MRKRTLTELNRQSIEDFKLQPKTPLVILLDNVRSALNVGSAFRTADAFALEGVYLCGITAQPPNREITKTALGATESVDWHYMRDTVSAIEALKKQGYMIVAIEQAEGSVALQEFAYQKHEKYAFIFGNEVNGVSDEVMDRVDACIEIPQFGTKHSLNISVCVGIVVWAFFQNIQRI